MSTIKSQEVICFPNGLKLNGKLVFTACSKVLEAIKNELQEEAHLYEVYDYIIDTSKELLKEKKIVL